MRLLLIIFLLLANNLFAAIGSVGTIGTAQDKTAGTTIVLTAANQLDAGNLGILIVTKDNACTADGETDEITGVVDSASNTYTQLYEYCFSAAGAGSDRATTAVFYTVATSNLAASGTVTATFSASTAASAATFWEFTIGAGSTLELTGTPDTGENPNDPPSETVGSLANVEHLFIRAIAVENDITIITGITVTTDYTGFTSQGTTGGGQSGNMSAHGEFRILTATTSTSDPTLVGGTADSSGFLIAVNEVAAAGSTAKRVIGGGIL